MQDHNVYTTGSIGGHKIVIATLPLGEYGVSQATGVIGDMVRSFPNLRCCLMVGIGGGAPSSHSDVRLGDVVVSAPVDRSGGILQYDHGEAIQGQNFRVTQHLNEPGKKFPDKVSAVCHIFANASVVCLYYFFIVRRPHYPA
jgi:nucleoside phosphorylase